MKPIEFIKLYKNLNKHTHLQKFLYNLANEIEDDRRMINEGVTRAIAYWQRVQSEPIGEADKGYAGNYDPSYSDFVKTLLDRTKIRLNYFNQLIEILDKPTDETVLGQTFVVIDLSPFSENDMNLVRKAQPTNTKYVSKSETINKDDSVIWFSLPGRVDGFREGPIQELKKQGYSEAFINLCNDAWNQNCLWIKFIMY